MRRQAHVVGDVEGAGPARHHDRIHQRRAGGAGDHEVPVAAGGLEQVVHAVDDGGARFGQGEDGDGGQCGGHGRQTAAGLWS